MQRNPVKVVSLPTPKAVMETAKAGNPVPSDILPMSKGVGSVRSAGTSVKYWSPTWDEICHLVQNPIEVDVPLHDPTALKEAKTDLPYLVRSPAEGRRNKSIFKAASCHFIDLDTSTDENGEVVKYAGSFDAIVSFFKQKNIRCAIYQTMSSQGRDRFRGRVVIPSKRYLDEHALDAVGIGLTHEMNKAGIPVNYAAETGHIHQAWFLPAVPKLLADDYLCSVIEGPILDHTPYLQRPPQEMVLALKPPADGDTSDEHVYSKFHDGYGELKRPLNRYSCFLYFNNNGEYFHRELVGSGNYKCVFRKFSKDPTTGDRKIEAARYQCLSSDNSPGVVVFRHGNLKFYLKSFHKDSDPLAVDKHTGQEIRAMDAIEFMSRIKFPEFKPEERLKQRDAELSSFKRKNLPRVHVKEYIYKPYGKGFDVWHVRGPFVDPMSVSQFALAIADEFFTDDKGKIVDPFTVWKRQPKPKIDGIFWEPTIDVLKSRFVREQGKTLMNVYEPPYHVKPRKMDLVDKIWQPIIEQIFYDDPEYIHDFIAYMLQTSNRPKVVPVIICTHRGMGRSFMGEILSHLVGTQNAFTTKLAKIAGQLNTFTEALTNKRFTFVPEATGSRYDIDADLRYALTERTIEHHLKYQDSYRGPCYACVIICSNEMDAISFGDDETRYVVYVNENEPNHAWWHDHAVYDTYSRNENFHCQVRQWYLERDITDFKPAEEHRPPTSAIYFRENRSLFELGYLRAMKEFNLHITTPELFLSAFAAVSARDMEMYHAIKADQLSDFRQDPFGNLNVQLSGYRSRRWKHKLTGEPISLQISMGKTPDGGRHRPYVSFKDEKVVEQYLVDGKLDKDKILRELSRVEKAIEQRLDDLGKNGIL